MEELKEIIKKYPDALNNRQKLRALFLDYFPDKKKYSNILLMLFDEDIFKKIQTINSINIPKSVKIINEIVIYCYMASKGLEYARKLGFKIENAVKA